MGRNIIIFSDGTGQAGGIHFDERRSNIYKMYRAMRCGPDSTIDPQSQVAFYDPGLGSPLDGSALYRGPVRWIYDLVSQATGFGITANIVDCYAALIRLWRPGDRIFLFGFSRGAYTIRCLAGVLRYCGIPTHMPDGSPVPLDKASTQALANYAVKHVYQFTTSRLPKQASVRQNFLLETRKRIARRFRAEHGSEWSDDPDRPNAAPYFIGAFDTVASLFDWRKFVPALFCFIVAFAIFAGLSAWAALNIWGIRPTTTVIVEFSIILILALYVLIKSHLKFDFNIPGYTCSQHFRTIHFTELLQRFYDTNLYKHIPYAKHALSIDENREAFGRVKWDPDNDSAFTGRDSAGNIYFEQVWFSGVHSDIGGSYAEDESRLSDIALKWMVDCATAIPDGLQHDPGILRAYPDPAGFQHDARKDGIEWITRNFGVTYPLGYRDPPKEAVLHPTVYDRFDAAEVPIYDRLGPYRPAALQKHVDVAHLYLETKSADPQKAARTKVWGAPQVAPRPTPRKIYPQRPKARRVRRAPQGQCRKGF